MNTSMPPHDLGRLHVLQDDLIVSVMSPQPPEAQALHAPLEGKSQALEQGWDVILICEEEDLRPCNMMGGKCEWTCVTLTMCVAQLQHYVSERGGGRW